MLEINVVSRWVDWMRPWPWRKIAASLSVSFILASAVSTALGYLFMQKLSGQGSSKSAAPTAETNWTSGPTLSKPAIDRILERNIFNSDGSTGDVASPNQPTNTIARTQLPIKVVGIIYGGNPFNGISIIENKEKRTSNSFMVGDPLPPDAVIKEIQIDRVLLEIQGRVEYAPLEDTDIQRSTRKGKRIAKPADDSHSTGSSGFATEPPPEVFTEDGFARKGNQIEMTQAYKNKLLTTDFANVLQDAKASPNMVDGVLRGWRMDRIRKNSLWEKAGIQNNDVIEEINGVVLSDASQSIKLLQGFRNETDLDIRIKRNGQPISVNFKIK